MLSKTYLGLVIGIVIVSLTYLIVQMKYPSLTEGFAEKHHVHHHVTHHKHHAHHESHNKHHAHHEVHNKHHAHHASVKKEEETKP